MLTIIMIIGIFTRDTWARVEEYHVRGDPHYWNHIFVFVFTIQTIYLYLYNIKLIKWTNIPKNCVIIAWEESQTKIEFLRRDFIKWASYGGFLKILIFILYHYSTEMEKVASVLVLFFSPAVLIFGLCTRKIC